MRAAYITRTGPPQIIQYGNLPEPSVGPGHCLVQVSAVDVNPIDVYWRAGIVPAPMTFPFVLGRDLTGTVIAVGGGVGRFRTGDRVWATSLGFDGRPGASAERVVVEEQWLHPVPDNVSDEDIVAVSLVGVTAWLGLANHARLRSGEAIFVNGGSGGVGSCVLQIAKLLGARVVTTAGSPAKTQRCRDLGADHVINYKTQSVAEELRKWAPEGVDVWWETLRDPSFELTVPLLARQGRMVVMAGREARPAFPVGPFYVKDCSLHGFAMFNAPCAAIREAAERISAWMADGRLRAALDRVLPLSDIVEAHRLQEDSTVHGTGALAGKIVLKL